MKKKQIRKLISLFECLSLAGTVLSGKTVPEIAALQIRAALQTIREIREDPDNKFLIKVFDEIDHYLYHLPDSSRIEFYVEDILRGFADVAPFLCYLAGNSWPEDPNNDADYDFPEECRATLRLLSTLREDTDIDDDRLSEAAKYVFSCYAILLIFSKSLDSRCLHFKLNLYEIQDRLGIYIFYDRDYMELINAGYWDKVLEEVSKDETPQKALPEVPVSKSPQIRPFADWLRHKNPEKLASVCKQVFDVNHRPKDYAIMLCLLHQKGYISIPEKHRTDFYDSWFAFIGKPFPKNRNYYSINKNIDTYEGFQIINDDEPYYVNLQALFERKLRS